MLHYIIFRVTVNNIAFNHICKLPSEFVILIIIIIYQFIILSIYYHFCDLLQFLAKIQNFIITLV